MKRSDDAGLVVVPVAPNSVTGLKPTDTPDRQQVHQMMAALMLQILADTAAQGFARHEIMCILGAERTGFSRMLRGKGSIIKSKFSSWGPVLARNFPDVWARHGAEFELLCTKMPDTTKQKIIPPPQTVFPRLMYGALRLAEVGQYEAITSAAEALNLTGHDLSLVLREKIKFTRNNLQEKGWPDLWFAAFPDYVDGQKREDFDAAWASLPQVNKTIAQPHVAGSLAQLLENKPRRQAEMRLHVHGTSMRAYLKGDKFPKAYDVYANNWPAVLAEITPERWKRYGYLFLIQVGKPTYVRKTRLPKIPTEQVSSAIESAWKLAAATLLKDFVGDMQGGDVAPLAQWVALENINDIPDSLKRKKGDLALSENWQRAMDCPAKMPVAVYEDALKEICLYAGLPVAHIDPRRPRQYRSATEKKLKEGFAVRIDALLKHCPH